MSHQTPTKQSDEKGWLHVTRRMVDKDGHSLFVTNPIEVDDHMSVVTPTNTAESTTNTSESVATPKIPQPPPKKTKGSRKRRSQLPVQNEEAIATNPPKTTKLQASDELQQPTSKDRTDKLTQKFKKDSRAQNYSQWVALLCDPSYEVPKSHLTLITLENGKQVGKHFSFLY